MDYTRNDNVTAPRSSHNNREIVEQLRYNSALDYKGLSDTINRNIIKNIYSDDKITEMHLEATLEDARRDLDNKVNQTKVFVYQKVSKEDAIRLKNTFWMFNLDFSKATDTSGHAFWRAYRLISEKKMLFEEKVTKHSRPINGKNVVYKDVGGNPLTHLNRKEEFVHTCAPLLSNNDDKRKSAYKCGIRRYSRYENSTVFRLHNEQNSQVICSRKSQHCSITAELLIFLHSSYDMSVNEIADAMHRADASVARGCFHFNPRVLYEDQGILLNGLCFKKYLHNGRAKIRFWFEKDNQEGYEHDWINYIGLIRTFRLKSTIGEPRYYNVQFETTDDDVTFFTIRRSISGKIPSCRPFRVFTDESLDDKIILYYWRWNTLNPGTFFIRTSNHMTPIRMIVPKKLFNKMLTFADTLPESKFNVKNILIAGASFNTREVISGQNIGVVKPISPSDLKNLANAVFLMTYISNYEVTKTVSTLVNQEDSVRKMADRSFPRRWFSKQARAMLQSIGLGSKGHSYDHFDTKFSLEDGTCERTNALVSFIEGMRKSAEVSRKFDIVVRDCMCQFMTIEEELDALTLGEVSVDRGFTTENILNDYLDVNHIREANFCTLNEEKSFQKIFDKTDMKVETCTSDLEIVHNESDGHCIFQSMHDAGMYSLTNVEIRRKLYQCSAIETMRNSEDQKRILSCIDGTPDGYGNIETLLLASLDTSISVCVHHNGLNYRYGKAPYAHFDISNHHCQYMKPVHTFGDIPTYLFENVWDKEVIDHTIDNRVERYRTFLNSEKPTKTKFKKDLQVALSACWPLVDLGLGNYVSRDGLRMAEILERFFVVSEFQSVLTLGGPGGEVQAIAEKKNCTIFGCANVDDNDYSNIVDYPCFTQLYGDKGDGDITNMRNIVSMRRAIRSEFPQGVDLFSATALTNDLSDDEMKELIHQRLLFCIVTLRKGGDAVFALPDVLTSKSPLIIYMMWLNFEDVRVVKLETSRPTNPEFHIICRGFRRDIAPRQFCEFTTDNVPEDFVNFLRHMQRDMDNLLLMGLNKLRKTHESIGTRTFRQDKFDDETLRGYRARLCISEKEDAGVFDRVTRYVRSMYDSLVPDTTDYMQELEEEFDEIVHTPIVRNITAESVESFHTAITSETVPIVTEAKKKKKFSDIFRRKKKIDPVTVMGETKPCIVTQVPLPSFAKHSFTLTDAPKSKVLDKEVNEAKDKEKETPSDETVSGRISRATPQDAMKEFLALTKFTHDSELSNHKRVAEKLRTLPAFRTIIENENGNYQLLVKRNDSIMTIYRKKDHIYPTSYNRFYHDGAFRAFAETENLPEGTEFLVSDYCELCIDIDIYRNLAELNTDDFVLPEDTKIVQAAAGCGKTTFIVNNSVPPHIAGRATILLSTCEGRDDYIARIERKYDVALSREDKNYVRTLASYLVNHNGKNKATDVLYVDEALMSHPGAVMYAIMMCGAKLVRMLGDGLQIPFVNRTPGFVAEHTDLAAYASVGKILYKSYRCPADVAARLDKHYLEFNNRNGLAKGMHSVRNIGNTCVVKKIRNDNVPYDKEYQYLTFTQSDKKKLIAKLGDNRVSTVHEYQGKESKRIRVVRFDPYKTTELFERFNYALVAITRHTESLEYYTRVDTDALSRLIGVDNLTKFQAHTDEEINAVTDDSAGAIINEHHVTPVCVNYSVLPVIPNNIRGISGDRMFFVPRYGVKKDCLHKPPNMRRDVIFQRRGVFNDIFVVSSDNMNESHNIRTLKRSLALFNNMREDFDLGDIYLSDAITDDIDRATFGYTMRKHSRGSFVLCSNSDDHDAPNEVFEILTKNGMNDLPNAVIHSMPVYRTQFVSPLECPVEFVPEQAQCFLNDCFGDICYDDQHYDSWQLQHNDLTLDIGDVKFGTLSADTRDRQFDYLRPLLHTPVPIIRDFNRREMLVALEKRNRNVPHMNGVVDFENTSDRMLHNLVEECFDKERLEFSRREPIRISTNSVSEWLSKQKSDVRKVMVPDFALHETALNSYNFSIKRRPKPNLTVDATSSYLALQTIVYHEKSINAMFCSIFRELKNRIKYSLHKHIKIFSDVSAEDFAKELDEDIPTSSIPDLIEKLEIDISKYDKSQRELALEFECKLMRFFGVDEDIVQLWYNAHVLTEIYDKVTKIRALIPYQRKSGDASTFLGNTMFLLAVLADRIPLSTMFMVLVSGDDSLIYGYNLDKYKDTQHFGLKFNLEIKFFNFDISYFCSKFLIPINDMWSFVPDPLKLVTKLGRSDLINESHVNEYRISIKDSVKPFRDFSVCHHIGEAVKERYGLSYNYCEFFRSLPSMCKHENFSRLFYSNPGDRTDNRRDFSDNFD